MKAWRETLPEEYVPREVIMARLDHVDAVLNDIKHACVLHQRAVLSWAERDKGGGA